MTVKRYTDEEQEAFIEVAKDLGISKAMRTLGYPGSWDTGNRWFTSRGIEAPVVSEVHAMANAMKQALGEKELLAVGQQGLERVLESLNEKDLTADDIKKLMEAYQKAVNTMNLVQGKATDINESRYGDVTPELEKMLNEQEEKNIAKAASVMSQQYV